MDQHGPEEEYDKILSRELVLRIFAKVLARALDELTLRMF